MSSIQARAPTSLTRNKKGVGKAHRSSADRSDVAWEGHPAASRAVRAAASSELPIASLAATHPCRRCPCPRQEGRAQAAILMQLHRSVQSLRQGASREGLGL